MQVRGVVVSGKVQANGILNALSGLVCRDYSQVVLLVVDKYYGEYPQARVMLYRLAGE